ncbi:hypothetical protein SEA_RIPARIAN_66 [Mycobacterium phage Riparian]|uniref:Uncharacterized protein n=2 Tax=Papyrusvirus send513 TaxID=1982556 RepID=A0A3G3LWY5_9CAUD|nr:hypothetical protein SEA_RIPARIAN_66 [Mycobacterium phage Riparian]
MMARLLTIHIQTQRRDRTVVAKMTRCQCLKAACIMVWAALTGDSENYE